MKKLFLLLLMFLSILTFSQNIVTAKYMEMLEFNYQADDYEIIEERWADVRLEVSEDYFILNVEGETTKFWWEFDEKECNKDMYVFYTENEEEKMVFDDTEEEIGIFFEYNKRTDRYEGLIILSKIEEGE